MGAPSFASSRKRELAIIAWLDRISEDAQCIFLVGDIFDFWFEYKQVVPKGFVRLQGKIAALVDAGIDVYFFLGNHDMWMKNYFTKELGVTMITDELELDVDGKKFFIAHGDGLGPGDHGYKFIKGVFRNKFCQFLFSCLHPRIGLSLAQYFSNKSRIHTGTKDDNYDGKDAEWLYQFSKEKLKSAQYDYFIFVYPSAFANGYTNFKFSIHQSWRVDELCNLCLLRWRKPIAQGMERWGYRRI